MVTLIWIVHHRDRWFVEIHFLICYSLTLVYCNYTPKLENLGVFNGVMYRSDCRHIGIGRPKLIIHVCLLDFFKLKSRLY